jgi:hypothetical protein
MNLIKNGKNGVVIGEFLLGNRLLVNVVACPDMDSYIYGNIDTINDDYAIFGLDGHEVSFLVEPCLVDAIGADLVELDCGILSVAYEEALANRDFCVVRLAIQKVAGRGRK